MLKKRRAISEIIATVIIILITTVLGAVLYNITLSQTNSQSAALVSSTNDQESLTKERVNILTVARTDPSHICITFMNYGKIDVVITDVYINNIWTHYPNGYPTSTSNLNNIIISVPNSSEYYILLVSSRGGSTAYTWQG